MRIILSIRAELDKLPDGVSCSDGNYYLIKFQNNRQHLRILVNELLGTRLAGRMGLPTTPVSVVEVHLEWIRLTPERCIETPRARIPGLPGPQFGSRHPGDPRHVTLHDFLPDEQLTCTILPACWCSTSGPAIPMAGKPYSFRSTRKPLKV